MKSTIRQLRDLAEWVVVHCVAGRQFHRFAAADTGFELDKRSRASRPAKKFLLRAAMRKETEAQRQTPTTTLSPL